MLKNEHDFIDTTHAFETEIDPWLLSNEKIQENLCSQLLENNRLKEEVAIERRNHTLWNGQTFFTEEEAVKYLRLRSVKSLRYLVRTRELAHVPFGKGDWVFRKQDLDKLAEKKCKKDSWE